jgi:hypothetical protein
MPSPFPGMDPYLEGALWPDVHSALAAKVRQLLAPQVRPRYVVRLAVYLVEDSAPDGEIGILYPDVEVLRPATVTEGVTPYAAATTPFTPAILVPARRRLQCVCRNRNPRCPRKSIGDRHRNPLAGQ